MNTVGRLLVDDPRLKAFAIKLKKALEQDLGVDQWEDYSPVYRESTELHEIYEIVKDIY